MSASTLTRAGQHLNAITVRQSALPKVSVIVPCYNEERFIRQTLENLIKQYPSKAYEIIVVDVMSSD